MRSPRMQGFPPRLPGSIVMMSVYGMLPLYGKSHCRAIGDYPLEKNAHAFLQESMAAHASSEESEKVKIPTREHRVWGTRLFECEHSHIVEVGDENIACRVDSDVFWEERRADAGHCG